MAQSSVHHSATAQIHGQGCAEFMRNKLTPKQAHFVAEYLIDLNATQAAIRASYSERTADQQGSRLLANVKVRATLTTAVAKRAERTEITQDMVIREFAKLAFADMADYVRWGPDGVRLIDSGDLPDGGTAAVVEVSEALTQTGKVVRFKLADKTRALDSLAKHLGMFVEHREPPSSPPIRITRVTIVLPPGHEPEPLILEGQVVES